MRLCLFECKKIWKQRMNWMLLIVFTFLSIFLFHNMSSTNLNELGRYYKEDGSLMSVQEVQKEISKAKEKWSGTMDETWWNTLQVEYQVSKYSTSYRLIDFDKMNATYGETWYNEYATYPERFSYPGEIDTQANLKVVHVRDTPLPNKVEDIYIDVTQSLFMNYASTMLTHKQWNSSDGTYGTGYGMDGKVHKWPVYTNSNLSSHELTLLKDFMNEQESFHYADSKNWMEILRVLSSIGIFSAIWVIVISSNSINKERSNGMLEVLSAAPKGGSKLFVSKLLATCICGVTGLCVMVGGLLVYAMLTGQIGDPNVNITEGLVAISIFTYGESFVISMGVMLLGILVTSLVGVLLSTWLTSSYLSLAITFLLIFLPQFIQKIAVLFPIEFMRVSDVAITRFTIDLFDHAFLVYRILPLLYLPICVILGWISWRKFINKNYQRI